jgi:glucan phosphorylase
LRQIEKCSCGAEFRDACCLVKLRNKINLALRIISGVRVAVNSQSLIEIQVKQINDYERL